MYLSYGYVYIAINSINRLINQIHAIQYDKLKILELTSFQPSKSISIVQVKLKCLMLSGGPPVGPGRHLSADIVCVAGRQLFHQTDRADDIADRWTSSHYMDIIRGCQMISQAFKRRLRRLRW